MGKKILIVNLDAGQYQLDVLKKRLFGKGKKRTVEVYDPKKDSGLAKFKDLKGGDKIYILAHGVPNFSFASGYHYDDVAKLISNARLGPEDELDISLIVCHAAKGAHNDAKSFGALLNGVLKESYKIESQVKARKDVVMLNADTSVLGKHTMSAVAYACLTVLFDLGIDPSFFYKTMAVHQGDDKKVIFSFDLKGNQMETHAYIYKKFKADLGGLLIMLEHESDKSGLAFGLLSLLEMYGNPDLEYTPAYALEVLEILKSHEDFLSTLDLSDAIKTKMRAIIDKYENMLKIIVQKDDDITKDWESVSGAKFTRDVKDNIYPELRALPKTERERPLKDFFTDKENGFIIKFWPFFANKIKNRLDVEEEMALIVLLKKSLIEMTKATQIDKEVYGNIKLLIKEYRDRYEGNKIHGQLKGIVSGISIASDLGLFYGLREVQGFSAMQMHAEENYIDFVSNKVSEFEFLIYEYFKPS